MAPSVGELSHRPGLPAGLAVVERPPAGGWRDKPGPVVVMVHGSLDRAASFARTARRLPEMAVVAYDRRGYQGSRPAGVARALATHVDDLLHVVSAYAAIGPVTAVGHSIGGTITLAAVARAPARFASIAVYEPSLPWLGPCRGSSDPAPGGPSGDPVAGDPVAGDPVAGGPIAGDPTGHGTARNDPAGGDPGRTVEHFFRRVVGDGAWERLPLRGRADRLADGPALMADLTCIGTVAPFDATALTTPVLVATGGPASEPRHRCTADWLAEHVAGARRAEIAGATHGAHLSHPDAFAGLVRRAVALDRPAGGRATATPAP